MCALSPKVSDVLRITKLRGVLQPYIDEADAIASTHNETGGDGEASGPLVLCAEPSTDVLAYLRGLLEGDGVRVVTAEKIVAVQPIFRPVRTA